MADFANPLVIGGNFNVLSTDIFFAVVGAAHDQGRAAVLAIVLLAFTLTAFLAQRLWLGRRSYATVTGKGDAGIRWPLPPALRVGLLRRGLPWLVLTVAVYGIILVGGFVVSIGRDNTPTLEYFWTAFSVRARRRRLVPSRLRLELVHHHDGDRADRHAIYRRARHPDRVAAGPPKLPRPAQLRVPRDDELRHSRHGDRHQPTSWRSTCRRYS